MKQFLVFHRVKAETLKPGMVKRHGGGQDVLGGTPKTAGEAPVLPKFAWRHPWELGKSEVEAFIAFDHGQTCGGEHAEPGFECAGVPIPGGAAPAV